MCVNVCGLNVNVDQMVQVMRVMHGTVGVHAWGCMRVIRWAVFAEAKDAIAHLGWSGH